MNVRSKTFSAVLSLNFIFIILGAILYNQQLTTNFVKSYSEALSRQVSVGNSEIDGVFETIYLQAVSLSCNDRFKTAVAKTSKGTNDANAVATMLEEVRRNHPEISDAYCIIPASHQLISSKTYGSVRTLTEEETAAILKKVRTQHGIHPQMMTDTQLTAYEKVLFYRQPVISDSGETMAELILTIRERKLYHTYLHEFQHGDDRQVFLLDGEGRLISGSLALAPDESTAIYQLVQQTGRIDAFKHVMELRGHRYTFTMGEMPFSGVNMCLLSSHTILESRLLAMQGMVFLGVLFLLSLSALVLYFVSGRLTEPVERLASVMKRAGDGDISVRAKVTGHDEIAYLATAFNQMLAQIGSMVDHLAAEKAAKKEAELNALQYQIRPHFIYNVLNSLRFAAMLQGVKNIGNLLADFVGVLQASLNRKGSFSTLDEELDVLKSYVRLQTFRMLDTFDVQFDIADNTRTCRVPRLILQPLVENSILHGPSEKKPFCHISVRTSRKAGLLCLEVEDDGQGLDAKTLARLNKVTGSTVENTRSHGGLSGIGIENIRERLRLYYGPKGSLVSESDGRTFPRASLYLPANDHTSEEAAE